MSKMWWRKQKTLAMLANRKQWQLEHDPVETQAQEIELEQGGSYIVIEASLALTPTFIITE